MVENDSWKGAEVYRLLTLVQRETQSASDVLAALPFGVAIADATGKILDANRRFEQFAGSAAVNGSNLLREAISEVLRFGGLRSAYVGSEASRVRASVHEFRHDTVILVLDPPGQAQHARDEELIAVIDSPAYVHVEHAGITAANAAFERLCGYTRDQLLRMEPGQLHGPGVWPWIFESGTRKTQVRTAAGETLPVAVRVTHITRENNAAVVTIRPESNERPAFDGSILPKLQHVCGGTVHHLNNSLMVLLSAAEALRNNFGSVSAIRCDLDAIQAACNRMSAMSSALLSFSEGRAAILTSVPAEETVRAAEPLFWDMLRGRAVEVVSEAPGIHVRVGPGDLESVVTALAQNAAEATSDGGAICIETSRVDPEYLLHNDMLEKHELSASPHFRLRVRDKGRGIPPEHRNRLFEPFFTTKPGRMGLGLATVFGIVKRAGGAVVVQSELGSGTTVDVLIPATAP